MEHALSVDLSELVGGKDGGGAKHVALFGNTLAVATDHAVFLLAMTFHVRGIDLQCHTCFPIRKRVAERVED